MGAREESLIKKYGEEKARQMIHEWAIKGGKKGGKAKVTKGFGSNKELASEAGKRGAKTLKERYFSSELPR